MKLLLPNAEAASEHGRSAAGGHQPRVRLRQ